MLDVLSIDLEEWFCVSGYAGAIRTEEWETLESRIEAETAPLLKVLDGYGVKATFFVLGWVADRHPELIRDIASRGHEIASHGYGHQLVYEMGPDRFRDDLERSLEAIGKASGRVCRGYRATSFSLRTDMRWAWNILREHGIEYDSSIFPVLHDRYGEPTAPRAPFEIAADSGPIVEFPLATVRVLGRNWPVAGGGYLRLYPEALTIRAIERIHREGNAAIIYVHPWETDPEQPVPPAASFLTVLRHKIGMRTVIGKLERLMKSFHFGPFEELMKQGGLKV